MSGKLNANFASSRFGDKGIELSGSTESELDFIVTSSGYEEKQFKIGPGKTIKKVYLKKRNKTANR